MPSRLLSPRVGLAFAVVLLIGAFGLRVWNLNAPSIWHDEGWSIRAIRDPIGTPDDKTPLAYYSLIHFLWLGAGESPLALRYGSVLLGLLTVAVGIWIVRRWANWDAAILAGILLGTSPLLWAYSREIRAYAAVPLLTLVLLWQADDLLKPRARFPWRVWAAALIVELIFLYTHNLSVPAVAWLNLVVGGVWLWQRRWRWLGIWLIGQAALLLAYVPWLLSQSPSGTSINTPPRLDGALVWDIWQGYFAPLPTMIGTKNALMIGSALFGLAAALSIAAISTWNWNRHTQLILSQALMLPALATVELQAAHINFHPRYYLASAPAALMLIAFGVDSLPPKLDLQRAAIPLVLAMAMGVSAASLTMLFDDPKYGHDDFHALSTYYAELPPEAIILIPYGWEPAIEEYYAGKIGIQAEILGIDLHSDAETVMTQINTALEKRAKPVRVELLTWYQLPADLRGMYPCLLESAGYRLRDAGLVVQGITTTGYMIERPLSLVNVPDTPIDYGQVVLSGAALSGQQAVCLRTIWQIRQPSHHNWRVAGRLLTTDPPGWIIARSDTDIRSDDQLPTSQWDRGDQGDGFSLLRYPDGTPPGDYKVQVGVYSGALPDGLDRLVNGVPAGRAVSLATVQPAGTTDNPLREEAFTPVRISADPVVELTGYDAKLSALSPGQELRITLHWHVAGGCCRAEPWSGAALTLHGADWDATQPVAAYAAYSLDWHSLIVPADASGTAALIVESGASEPVTLATYTIEKTDRLFSRPAFDVPVQTTFTGLAVLEGFSVGQTVISPDEKLDLTLVWRALRTPQTSYRVFTHLLNADGKVIAQQDGFPVNNTRPTTGWVPDEYIVDPYALEFLPEGRTYRGPAHLEVGFYDPDTGQRVLAAGGADHIILPIEITVQ
jgi:hypothetical protein